MVPHDGTEISDIALDEAIRFAKIFNSKLTLLFVVEEQIVPPSLILSFIKSGSEIEQSKKNIISLLKTGAEVLLKDRSKKLTAANIPFDLQIGIGSPSKEILRYVEENNVDIIIMGRKQISGLGSMMALGSVARKVSELSKVPTMLVHHNATKEDKRPYSNILVPYDGSEFSDRATECAVKIAESCNSTILLFNTVDEILLPPTMQTLKFKSEITDEMVSKEVYLKELHQKLKNEMLATLETVRAKYKNKQNIVIDIEVNIGYPPESIIRKIAEGKHTLVIMGTVGLRGISKLHALGSVARKVSENSSCNILLVH